MTEPRFLTAATPDRLLRAVAANHRRWMVRLARAGGGAARREGGATWIAMGGGSAEVTIPFPGWRRDETGAALDAILAASRHLPGIGAINCWAVAERSRPRGLAAHLLARGFEWGWQPHWMWRDLRTLPDILPAPARLRIGEPGDLASWEAPDLPYFDRDGATRLLALGRARPRRVWPFVAALDGRPVGQSALHLTTGPLGVAGIFSVGVVPTARRRGIGAAVTLAALRRAAALGCRYAVLNATPQGESTYRRLGFASLGRGQTWWLHRPGVASPPPPGQVRFVAAIGLGDRAALDGLVGQLDPADYDQLLPCGLTPLQVAVRLGQEGAARWLVNHGATLDILSAWDLGWRALVPRLLAADPALANRRTGRGQTTPLHEAALRGDVELARCILAADPDLDARDRDYGGAALTWARHFGRAAIVALIEAHRPGR